MTANRPEIFIISQMPRPRHGFRFLIRQLQIQQLPKETITVKDAKTELYASKVDTDALSTAVAGATFTVTGIFTDTQSGAATDSKTVVSSSSLLLKDLQTNLEGKLIASTDELDTTHVYTIEETVPTPGYVLPEAGTQTYKIRILSPDAAAANASHPNGVLQYQITDGSNTSWTYVTSSNIGTDVANAVKFFDKKSLVYFGQGGCGFNNIGSSRCRVFSYR